MFLSARFDPQGYTNWEEYSAALSAHLERTQKQPLPEWLWLVPMLLVALALLALAVVYLIHAVKHRGSPPVRRSGTGLISGFAGFGPGGGKPTGGGLNGTPGSIALYDRNSSEHASEDPRKR